MKEFNYKRAWEQYVRPEFTKMAPALLSLVQDVTEVARSLEQVGASHQLKSTPPELVSLLVKKLDEIPLEELAWASQVVYYFGHLAPNGEGQQGGAYWKFQMLADQSVLGRKGGNEALYQAKLRMKTKLEGFHDHKEGSEYANEELAGLVQKLLPDMTEVEVLGAENVNFKPHPFVIGPKHFPTDGGMYIDPHRAPCAMKGCNLSYEEHTSERALFVRPKVEDEEKFRAALKKVLEVLEENSVKIDGFAMVTDSPADIEPEVEEFVNSHDDDREPK